MKKKTLLTSILAIVMCFSLITGATFALFTSEDKVNIAVTSGKVEVTATVENFEYKSLKQGWTAVSNNQTTFDNIGGSAVLNKNQLTLDKIVPGDAVKFAIKVVSGSDVTVKYRSVIKNLSADVDLFNALAITVNDVDYTGATASAWTTLTPSITEVETIELVIELPEEAKGANLMGKACKIEIAVEAIQGNATVMESSNLATALAAGGEVVLTNDIIADGKYTIPAGVQTTLDLNGYEINGICTASQGYMFMIDNTAKLTIKDSVGNGKITYAGDNSTGWIVDVEGDLVLESGILELTGTWSIGYAADVRPNAWGRTYTAPTTFVMNGGQIISSDGAVRVASSSYEGYEDISASFTMNGGKIDAAWDGVFVQQSNSIWDMLELTVNGGTIESDLNPIRIYAPAPTSFVKDSQCIEISMDDSAILTYTSTEERNNWIIDKVLRYGGGATEEQILAHTNLEGKETTSDGAVLTRDLNNQSEVVLSSVADVAATNYTVPAKVTSLGSGVFTNNANITTVTIPASITDFGATGVSATNASSGAFKNSNVTKVVLEEGMTEIPAAAFNGASKLTSVNIPSTVTTIGVNAFRSTALTELTIPATVKNISYGAFRDMDSLTTVTFEGDDVDIPNYAFRDCSNLRTVYINATTVTIGGGMAFANASSNNPGTNNITFYVKNAEVANLVKASMGTGSYVKIYVGNDLYAEIK